MDEPLLSSSGKVTRKSDHPFLSLISTSPRPRSTSPRAPDVLSPLSLFHDNEQDRRSEKFYAVPPKSPRFGQLPSVSNIKGPSVLTPDESGLARLFRIPEEETQIGCPSSSSAWQEPEVGDQDVESLLLTGERKHNDGGDDNTGVFGEPLIDDVEEDKGEKDNWINSGVTGLLLSALPSLQVPEVLNPFSSSPEPGFPAEDCTDEQNSGTNWTKSGLTGLLYNSLPELINPFSSSPDDHLLDLSAAPSSPSAVTKGVAKDENEEPGPQGHKLQAYVERREKKIFHRCRTAPLLSGCSFNSKREPNVLQSNRIATQSASSVVWQAFMGLCTYLFVGVIIYTWKREEFSGIETVGVVDALYFCIVTMCTIGYGDITPVTPTAKILSCALVFVGFGFIDCLLSGMVTFFLDRQEHLLLTVVEDGHHERAKNYVMDSKKGRMRIRMKVALAIFTVLMTMTVGVLFLHYMEDLSWIDALYVTCISITTVGYGDVSFQTIWGRLFAAVWLLLSTVGVARAILFLAEARVHKRHRHLAKRVLQRKMTSNDLMAMDLDNDGHISKSEFVVFKLKEMGKIEQTDVMEVCKQFDLLDSMNVGKITLAQLLEGEG